MSGLSYNEFYSLGQWTPYYQQSHPFLQQPYDQTGFTPYPQQFTNTDVLARQSCERHVNNKSEPPIRRKRASKPKVRTGCTTCKVSQLPSVFFCGWASQLALKTIHRYYFDYVPSLNNPSSLTYTSHMSKYRLTKLFRYGVSNATRPSLLVRLPIPTPPPCETYRLRIYRFTMFVDWSQV